MAENGKPRSVPGRSSPANVRPDGRISQTSRSALRATKYCSDLSFHVELTAETRIILGPAGCGKSLIMKLANGLLEPDRGEVLVFGQSLQKLSEADRFEMRAHVGMVFQESALFDSLNVEDNVAYRLQEEGADRRRRRTIVWSKRCISSSSSKAIDQVSLRAERRYAAARVHCPRDHQQARPDPVRLSHRRARSRSRRRPSSNSS